MPIICRPNDDTEMFATWGAALNAMNATGFPETIGDVKILWDTMRSMWFLAASGKPLSFDDIYEGNQS